MKPVLFVTGHAPADRYGAFAELHAREGIQLALFGGRHAHAASAGDDPPVPYLRVGERDVLALAASGDHRAVVAGTGGRTALPAAWRGARRAGVPFLFWAALWSHPRSLAHAAGYPLMLRIYRHAGAVVTYGEHVSAYVASKGARNVHIAPQAVDNEFWSQRTGRRAAAEPDAPLRALFVGRRERAKGLALLLDAWARSGLAADGAALDLLGELGDLPLPAGVTAHGPADPAALRNFYAAADVVVIPSIPTRTFREPWGLVANEAMNQRTAILATDAVGAAAGGLIRDERNGLIVPAGDPERLAAALVRLAGDPQLRRRLGDAGARDVAAYDHDAWAAGFSAALASVGTSACAPAPAAARTGSGGPAC